MANLKEISRNPDKQKEVIDEIRRQYLATKSMGSSKESMALCELLGKPYAPSQIWDTVIAYAVRTENGLLANNGKKFFLIIDDVMKHTLGQKSKALPTTTCDVFHNTNKARTSPFPSLRM